ncbi:glutathione S-transferase family protein [Jannaschia sp. LMIT008]|uniref:glutathione S-transferase family protein n=1 Tax=Jannaschia maritima TaxID=3032585 RepID=UPI002810FB23|nr:glutathione S-transferase family protein [Jannaschia sp. LMIT008]
MLVLHGQVRSRALRVLWLLEELDLPYRFDPVDPRSPEAFAVSPLGKIPALTTPDGVLFDSVAIMTWLADREGRFTHPAGTMERARQDAMTQAVLELLDAPLWEMAKHGFVLPEGERLDGMRASVTAQVARHSGDLAGLFDGDWVAGPRPTVPDILLAHCAGWARGLKMDLDGRVLDHMKRMRARPSFGRAMDHG